MELLLLVIITDCEGHRVTMEHGAIIVDSDCCGCRLENCRHAMELAKEHFGIPLVLSPENLSSPDLDELSGMTYLSYFMKVDSPGYNATLNWVRQQIPEHNVSNFQVSDPLRSIMFHCYLYDH